MWEREEVGLIKVELIMREMRERRMEPSFKYSPHFEVLHVDRFLGNRRTEGRKKGGSKKKEKENISKEFTARQYDVDLAPL